MLFRNLKEIRNYNSNLTFNELLAIKFGICVQFKKVRAFFRELLRIDVRATRKRLF